MLVVVVNSAMPPKKIANSRAANNSRRASSGQDRNSFNPPANVQATVPAGERLRQKKRPPHKLALANSQKSRTAGAFSSVARLRTSVPKVSNAPQPAQARIKEKRQSCPIHRRAAISRKSKRQASQADGSNNNIAISPLAPAAG